jgi:hypothetical protein
MDSSPTTVIVATRVPPRHAEQLRRLADEHITTVSRVIAAIVGDRLDGTDRTPSIDTTETKEAA